VLAATQTASEAVPVHEYPASRSACVLASVAVMTAFTSAASLSGTGTATTMLTVPGARAGGDASSRSIGASSGSGLPAGAAAHVGTRRPTVAETRTPPSSRRTVRDTDAAV